VERICRDLDIYLLLPLRKRISEKIVNEIIDAGFEMVAVSVKEGLLGKERLGCRIDREFIKDLRETDAS
jgi:diphthamide synthase (EF-2-diphthine--ammonia ligase)